MSSDPKEQDSRQDAVERLRKVMKRPNVQVIASWHDGYWSQGGQAPVGEDVLALLGVIEASQQEVEQHEAAERLAALAFRYWVTQDPPSDKEMYSAVADWDEARRKAKNAKAALDRLREMEESK